MNIRKEVNNNMHKQFCSECGSQIPFDSKFCTSCGHPVSASASQPEQQEHVQPSIQPVGGQEQKTNNTKWLLIGGAIIIGIIALFMINSKDSPEKVAEKFVEYMTDFKLEKVKDLLARDADEYLKDDIDLMLESLKNDPTLIEEQESYGYNIKNFKITDVDKGSTYTYVYGTITYMNGETEDIDIDLVKEDGKWKVEDTY